jgi:4-amino-4-deoxy-L-arabinose transferase-like glycosyltransferase
VDVYGARIFVYLILPLLMAGGLVAFDRNTRGRQRTAEVFLVFLLALGVAGSGIGGFIAHFFMSDIVAESIGWGTGSPFQLEIAFANLAIGILGLIAAGRRDGFREATVIAATTFSVGATVVHIMDIAATGNLAPGNTWQNVTNLARPALLIAFLVASRRADRDADPGEGPAFDAWRQPIGVGAGVVTGIVATGFGVGYAVGQTLIVTAVSVVVASIALGIIVARGARAAT